MRDDEKDSHLKMDMILDTFILNAKKLTNKLARNQLFSHEVLFLEYPERTPLSYLLQ